MDGRESWHRAESDARSSVGESAALISGNHAPRFLNSIQMMKTRSGMQVSFRVPVKPVPTAFSAKLIHGSAIPLHQVYFLLACLMLNLKI